MDKKGIKSQKKAKNRQNKFAFYQKRCNLIVQQAGEVAQLARASHWQCEGREFESLLLHHFCFAKMVNEA